MPFRWILIGLLAAALSGCSGYRRPPAAFHETLTQAYRLESSDQLRVIVFGQDTLSNNYIVDQSGIISFPLIGNVEARGKTQAELAAEIGRKLRQGYLRDPDVSVEVTTYRPFFIMGEVQNPGQYSYVAGMTAQNAIATAGGFSTRARQKDVDITRQTNGEILNGRVPISDPIRPGDTIYVRERYF
ncbi:polysaccharide biosynthesis/export family protein [Roseibium limicola]|uniref:Polysaccharide export protein n=1 Tax=Roseibium limicola TaxID=2816037 RepID=A0A939J7D4_9HYPH|nr:polysaccharide biosynthesis/export family protein [Roseibium limicola]MBO0346057.1 polysaccharide export protein [Roseibium limicola]